MTAHFYIVGSPIGNLQEITLRALETLRSVDRIFCEDTRRSIKLLNHYEIKKPLESCPYFKEESKSDRLIECLKAGEKVAFLSDAGMPGLSDPGARLVRKVRQAGFPLEVIGGVSSLTSFIAGLPLELESFYFTGFLPPKKEARKRFLCAEDLILPLVFLESTHRIQSTLEIFKEHLPGQRLILAKELSKISESFFDGTAEELIEKVPSWKGEWIGLACGP